VGSIPRADCSPHGAITLDNREELVVNLSTEMVEKDLQVK
jgi:septal ring factor EnvC (AmiA/AmiB activator)